MRSQSMPLYWSFIFMIQITRMGSVVNMEFRMIDKINLQSDGIIKKPFKSMNLKKVRDIKYTILIKGTIDFKSIPRIRYPVPKIFFQIIKLGLEESSESKKIELINPQLSLMKKPGKKLVPTMKKPDLTVRYWSYVLVWSFIDILVSDPLLWILTYIWCHLF